MVHKTTLANCGAPPCDVSHSDAIRPWNTSPNLSNWRPVQRRTGSASGCSPDMFQRLVPFNPEPFFKPTFSGPCGQNVSN